MSITGLIVWIVVGAIGGWLAGYLMHRNTTLSLGDVVLGMIGAVVGGWLSTVLLSVEPTGISVWSILSALVGALIVAWVYEAVTKRTAP
jgi:uncharacterized membrane protein YeaQ/YmgE (transglycosylase-associated protein family)